MGFCPDPPLMTGLVLVRTTLPPQAQHEQRLRDLVLRTSAAGVPVGGGLALPATRARRAVPRPR